MVDAASGQPVSVVEEVMVQETADLMSQPVSRNNPSPVYCTLF